MYMLICTGEGEWGSGGVGDGVGSGGGVNYRVSLACRSDDDKLIASFDVLPTC